MSQLWGDISRYNGLFDFEKAKSEGLKGIIIRLGDWYTWTQDHIDYEFWRNVEEAPKSFGPNVGGYWLFRPQVAVSQQTELVISLLKKYPQIKFLANDVEVQAITASQVLQFNFAISGHYATPKKSLVYTSPHAWNDFVTGDKAGASQYPLWQAQWATAPQILPPWNGRAIWQYSANGNGLGAEFGNGLVFNPETGKRDLQPTVNFDLDLVDDAWVAEVCKVDETFPKTVRVNRPYNAVLCQVANGKIISVAPFGLRLVASEVVKDGLGRDWYRVGDNSYIIKTSVEVLSG